MYVIASCLPVLDAGRISLRADGRTGLFNARRGGTTIPSSAPPRDRVRGRKMAKRSKPKVKRAAAAARTNCAATRTARTVNDADSSGAKPSSGGIGGAKARQLKVPSPSAILRRCRRRATCRRCCRRWRSCRTACAAACSSRPSRRRPRSAQCWRGLGRPRPRVRGADGPKDARARAAARRTRAALAGAGGGARARSSCC